MDTKQMSFGDNRLVAAKLDEVADLLQHQQANLFRVTAYRDAAAYVAALHRPISEYLADGGPKALEALPTIGPSIAASITELLHTGHLALLDDLRGDIDPERLLQTVPQIGPTLAAVIHEQLGIHTLEELEAASHNGKLAALPGFGPRRVRGIQYALKDLLARRRPVGPLTAQIAPPIPETLDVDIEYRRRAAAGSLPLIAPKRFNPGGKPWLPILHTERGKWHFTAMFSNTLRAHRLHRTHDWVIIQFETDGKGAGQCTVVTEHQGKLDGQRVIRGYEVACANHYAATSS